MKKQTKQKENKQNKSYLKTQFSMLTDSFKAMKMNVALIAFYDLLFVIALFIGMFVLNKIVMSSAKALQEITANINMEDYEVMAQQMGVIKLFFIKLIISTVILIIFILLTQQDIMAL